VTFKDDEASLEIRAESLNILKDRWILTLDLSRSLKMFQSPTGSFKVFQALYRLALLF